jgi:hypothetical protein
MVSGSRDLWRAGGRENTCLQTDATHARRRSENVWRKAAGLKAAAAGVEGSGRDGLGALIPCSHAGRSGCRADAARNLGVSDWVADRLPYWSRLRDLERLLAPTDLTVRPCGATTASDAGAEHSGLRLSTPCFT